MERVQRTNERSSNRGSPEDKFLTRIWARTEGRVSKAVGKFHWLSLCCLAIFSWESTWPFRLPVKKANLENWYFRYPLRESSCQPDNRGTMDQQNKLTVPSSTPKVCNLYPVILWFCSMLLLLTASNNDSSSSIGGKFGSGSSWGDGGGAIGSCGEGGIMATRLRSEVGRACSCYKFI